MVDQIRSLPEVRNGLVSEEQTAYNLAWGRVVNPSKTPISTIYNGIGPDLITVLRITNASDIHGVEFFPPSVRGLEHYMDSWEKVDNDPISLPPEAPQLISEYASSEPFNVELRRLFEERLERRNSDGYWDVGTIMPWGIERCIAIELKRMGVNLDSIKIGIEEGDTTIEFEWDARKRKVTYHGGDLLDAYNGKFGLPNVDCFYQKSIEGIQELWQKLTLEGLLPYINEEGIILLGRPQGTKAEQHKLEQQDRKILGREFAPLHIPSRYHTRMEEKQSHKMNQMSYGWELYGFRKR